MPSASAGSLDMVKMSELIYEEPFETKTEYVPMEDILNVPIVIVEAKITNTQKGKAAIIRLEDGHRLVTYAVSLVNALEKDAVKKALEAGEPVETMIKRVESTKTPGNMMLKFI